jgi:hypothetical protein
LEAKKFFPPKSHVKQKQIIWYSSYVCTPKIMPKVKLWSLLHQLIWFHSSFQQVLLSNCNLVGRDTIVPYYLGQFENNYTIFRNVEIFQK